MTRRFPGQPSARQEVCRQAYLELGPARSLEKRLAYLPECARRESKPGLCKSLATLKRWCSEQNWVLDAVRYDAEQAAKRSEFLAEQERQQAQEDVKTLAGTIRGAVAISAVLLSQYTDKQGSLVRQDANLRDVAALLRVCLDALHVIHPGHEPHQSPRYEIQRLLTHGTPEQRVRALQAMRELDAMLGEFDGEPGGS